MDWQKGEQSQNVEVSSGGRWPGFWRRRVAAWAIGGLLIMAVLGWIFFKNPMALFESGQRAAGGSTDRQRAAGAGRSAAKAFCREGARVRPRPPGTTSFAAWVALMSIRNSSCSAAASIARAARHRPRWDRFTVRAIKRFIWIWISSANWKHAFIPAAILHARM